MADNSKIEWTDATWNPIRARNRETGKVGSFCTHASEGCRNCYAERQNRRFGFGIDYRAQDLGRVEIFLDEKTLAQPLHWRRPRRIFVCSMSDLFGEFVPEEMIDRVFAVMAAAHWHTFQVLTKRAARMRGYWQDPIARAAAIFEHRRATPAMQSVGWSWAAEDMPWPLPNVHLGVSVEDQANADERIPELLATPAAVRFVSAEPLLGALDLTPWLQDGIPTREQIDDPQRGMHYLRHGTPRLDQIIVGGESGPGARPMHPAWARALRDQCQTAGVRFFFKQWGAWGLADTPIDPARGDGIWLDDNGDTMTMPLGGGYDRAGINLVAMRRAGKRVAGRLLDGRTWDELPA